MEEWDITLDKNGNLATTEGSYCDAQNVANAIRLFTNDAYLAMDEGVPHFQIDLGIQPAMSEVRSWYRKRAMGVENIRSASVDIERIDKETRTLKGTVSCINEQNAKFTIEI
jgi:hypothetical protein